jgi:hypothetical protein
VQLHAIEMVIASFSAAVYLFTLPLGLPTCLRSSRPVSKGLPLNSTGRGRSRQIEQKLGGSSHYSRATNTRFPASVIHIRVTSTAPSSSSRYSFLAATRPLGTSSIKTCQRKCSPTREQPRCSHLDERQSVQVPDVWGLGSACAASSSFSVPGLRERLHGRLSRGIVTENGGFAILPSGYRPHPWLACRATCGPHDPPNHLPVLSDHIIIIGPHRKRAAL